MKDENAIELHDISLSYTINVKDSSGKKSFLGQSSSYKKEKRVFDKVSLDIKKGEIVGIIGMNGSGKSSLLSIIARIIEPDSGSVEVSGKVASILELGMGFHQDLSGRENIYLKGELYGMSRKEVDSKIIDIISYSGISDYIDNPVRTYSSGMRGRLAFSIIVGIDSDIILIDEILSVGDIVFETKAREHFRKMIQSGKTVVIVSHSTRTIEDMCSRAIWIDSGRIIDDGPAAKVCSRYYNEINNSPEMVMDLALAGVPEYQYRLSQMYRDGVVLEQNSDLYRNWIYQAASQGHTRAQVEYGDILITAGEFDEAINYYQSAAAKGDNEARTKLSIHASSSIDSISELISIFFKAAERGSFVDKFRYALLLLKTAWSNKDREDAFNAFMDASDCGSVEAKHQIGLMYRDGVGTSRDYMKMEYYLTEAANLGSVPSMIVLSDLYIQGRLLPKDDQRYFYYSLMAAKQGDGNSMFKVANAYREGIGVDVDITKSNEWFDRHKKTMLFWHYMWAADIVRSRSFETSLTAPDLFKMASDSFHPRALTSVIYGYAANGMDCDEAIGFMKVRADSGNIDALKRLASIYYDGAGTKRELTIAAELYEKAAQLGDSWSQNRVGELYRDGIGVVADVEKATKWFEEASKQGNVLSMNNLIQMYSGGLLPSSYDVSILVINLESMAKSGDRIAARILGNLYHDGSGVKRNLDLSRYWYDFAVRLGDFWCEPKLCELQRDLNPNSSC